MKLYFNLYLILVIWHLTLAVEPNIICFYDASSLEREGLAYFSITGLEMALEFCTHVIYGYAGINSQSLQLTSLNNERDIINRHFTKITALKDRYPHKKFLLSLDGNKDVDNPEKYIQLLEADQDKQQIFIDSALYLIRSYKFDGLDLAFQFSQNETKGIYNKEEEPQTWNKFKNIFTNKNNNSNNETIPKYEDHNKLFTNLVKNLRIAFKPHDLMLTLTVLPNVNSSMFYNATALVTNLDFINLLTFDYTTPKLNPQEATYSAPLYPLPVQGTRNIEHSVNYQVNYWISQRGVPRSKINIGIATYGRSWKMTLDSGTDGFPIVYATDGPAPSGYLSKTPGILTWTEICSSLPNVFNLNKTGHETPLQSVVGPYNKFVTYAFRPADANGEYGMWVSYDDPHIAASKAGYVKRRHLGGVALFDISFDDFHGICNGDKFPMLRYVKYKFI